MMDNSDPIGGNIGRVMIGDHCGYLMLEPDGRIVMLIDKAAFTDGSIVALQAVDRTYAIGFKSLTFDS